MRVKDIIDIIKKETEGAQTTTFYTDKGRPYTYVILPLESRMSPDFIKACVAGIERLMRKEIENSTSVLAIESKGFIITPLIALKHNLDWVALRKRDYRKRGQIVVQQKKAFKGGTNLFSVGLSKRDRVLIVEDIFSSGGTVVNTVRVLRKKGIKITGICAIYTRGCGLEEIRRETGIRAKAIARIDLKKGKPEITDFFMR